MQESHQVQLRFINAITKHDTENNKDYVDYIIRKVLDSFEKPWFPGLSFFDFLSLIEKWPEEGTEESFNAMDVKIRGSDTYGPILAFVYLSWMNDMAKKGLLRREKFAFYTLNLKSLKAEFLYFEENGMQITKSSVTSILSIIHANQSKEVVKRSLIALNDEQAKKFVERFLPDLYKFILNENVYLAQEKISYTTAKLTPEVVEKVIVWADRLSTTLGDVNTSFYTGAGNVRRTKLSVKTECNQILKEVRELVGKIKKADLEVPQAVTKVETIANAAIEAATSKTESIGGWRWYINRLS
jgi:hypothetical protein